MAVIVVLNRKGGSGKSTLATHIAAYAANQGMSVMLGDIDRQQSSRTWLSMRQKTTQSSFPAIQHWSNGGEGRLPAIPIGGHVLVLDTPGGLQGLELAKVVMLADAIVIPVCNGLFDRASAVDCITELKRLPKIASGKCAIGVVGMRIDSRTGGSAQIANWAAAQHVAYITHIRQSRLYVTCIEKGLTIFDAPSHLVSFDLVQWKPILEWLSPYLKPYLKPYLNPSLNANARAGILASSPSDLKNAMPRPEVSPPIQASAPYQSAVQSQAGASDAAKPDAKKGFFASLVIPEFLKKSNL